MPPDERSAEAMRKLCGLMGVAYEQEAAYCRGEIALPPSLRPDPSKTAETFRELAAWIKSEHLREVERLRAELEDARDPYFEIEGGMHERHDSCWCEPNLRERCSVCGRRIHRQPVAYGDLDSCERCKVGS